MGAFDAVTLAWAGSEYVIPGNRVTGAIAPIEIAPIEDVVTLEELGRCGERGTMPIAKLAMALARCFAMPAPVSTTRTSSPACSATDRSKAISSRR